MRIVVHADGDTRGASRWLAQLLLCAAALALLATLLAGGIWHVHKTAKDASTCPLCQIGNASAIQSLPADCLPPQPVIYGSICWTEPAAPPAPVTAFESPRAPPSAA
jgi:hypothetical protein